MIVASLIMSMIALVSSAILLMAAMDPITRSKLRRASRRRKQLICPCGHDYAFHVRDLPRECAYKEGGYGHLKCQCQGYYGEIPHPSYEELTA